MNINNVEDFSWLYALLKPFASFMHNHIFYKKVYTSGLENIPSEGAVIFAPNHQNALMDALIILSVKNWQPVFMARADIFAGQFVRRLLFFMKILPIFRIRDGRESLKQNDEIFAKSVQVLRKKTLPCDLSRGKPRGSPPSASAQKGHYPNRFYG